MAGSEIGIIAFGSTDSAIQETRHYMAEEGIKTDYMRIRAIPFSNEVAEFLKAHPRNYVVEMNRDGQLRQLLTLDYPNLATRLSSVAHIDGLPLTAKHIQRAILAMEEE